jgi:hypothetical protein
MIDELSTKRNIVTQTEDVPAKRVDAQMRTSFLNFVNWICFTEAHPLPRLRPTMIGYNEMIGNPLNGTSTLCTEEYLAIMLELCKKLWRLLFLCMESIEMIVGYKDSYTETSSGRVLTRVPIIANIVFPSATG